jgi:hypothetical protein
MAITGASYISTSGATMLNFASNCFSAIANGTGTGNANFVISWTASAQL